jgi:hypothetical protein
VAVRVSARRKEGEEKRKGKEGGMVVGKRKTELGRYIRPSRVWAPGLEG